MADDTRRTRGFSTQALGLAILAAALVPGPVRAPPQTSRALAITRVTVIDTSGPRPEQTVVVDGDRIVAVGPTATTQPPSGALIVEGRGKYLIPGLWDMHTHVTLFNATTLSLFVAHGVTGVRDLGAVPDSIARWRSQITSGALIGPRIIFSGSILSDGGGGVSFHVAALTPAMAREAVRANHVRGAEVIKVHSAIPRDAYFAAAEEARRLGLPLVGHLPFEIRVADALDAGQRGIEHLLGLPIALSSAEPGLLADLRDEAHRSANGNSLLSAMLRADVRALAAPSQTAVRAVLSRLSAAGVWVCPTLTDTRAYTVMKDSIAGDPRLRYLPASVRRAWIAEAQGMSDQDLAGWRTLFPASLRLVGDLHRAKVGLIAGTDAGSTYDLPGFDLHNELALLVRAGLSPLDALMAATRNAALAAGWGGRSGTISVGKLADLVLLDASPIEKIENTRRIAGVVAAGRWLDRAELARMRQGVERAAEGR